MTLPKGYELVQRDDAARQRKFNKGHSTTGNIKAMRKGGKPWHGPWRWHEQDAIEDAINHAKKEKR
jgi:hypothetical protein